MPSIGARTFESRRLSCATASASFEASTSAFACSTAVSFCSISSPATRPGDSSSAFLRRASASSADFSVATVFSSVACADSTAIL